MSRPPKKRIVRHRPRFFEFGPMCKKNEENECLELTLDQLEAMRLADLEGMSQEDAASAMDVSRQTFGRIVEQARKVVAGALINGDVLRISCDDFILFHSRELKCIACGHEWESDIGIVTSHVKCPMCSSVDIIKRKRCGKECNCPLKVRQELA